MSPKIGNVIENNSGLHIITQLTDGVVSDTEKLEDFIIEHTLVKVEGEWITIGNIIHNQLEMYLTSGIEIIKG